GNNRQVIQCVAFSPDGKYCATGGQDTQIMVWETATGNLRGTITGHRHWVTALYFVPGDRLVSISQDRFVRIWELNGDHPKEAKNGAIQRRQGAVSVDNLGVSPDGRHMMDEQLGEIRI